MILPSIPVFRTWIPFRENRCIPFFFRAYVLYPAWRSSRFDSGSAGSLSRRLAKGRGYLQSLDGHLDVRCQRTRLVWRTAFLAAASYQFPGRWVALTVYRTSRGSQRVCEIWCESNSIGGVELRRTGSGQPFPHTGSSSRYLWGIEAGHCGLSKIWSQDNPFFEIHLGGSWCLMISPRADKGCNKRPVWRLLSSSWLSVSDVRSVVGYQYQTVHSYVFCQSALSRGLQSGISEADWVKLRWIFVWRKPWASIRSAGLFGGLWVHQRVLKKPGLRKAFFFCRGCIWLGVWGLFPFLFSFLV